MATQPHCQRFVQQVVEKLTALMASPRACQQVMDLLVSSGVNHRLDAFVIAEEHDAGRGWDDFQYD